MDTQATDDLRSRYRGAGLVVFEDIDALAGECDAQEELVQMLDALEAAGGRVVLTASVSPGRLAGVVPRLQGRLDAGLTVPLVPPGPGVRQAIVQRYAALRKLDFSESATQTLADGPTGTVPELLDVLRQLEMSARPRGGRIDGHHARRWLASGNGPRRVRLSEVLEATARVFELRPSQLRSRSRRQAVVTARAVAMYLARQLTAKSLQQIGQYFGGRDHSTVMYGCRKAKSLVDSDPAVRRAVLGLQEKLQKG
jgi:chromosomal replication initiator protein